MSKDLKIEKEKMLECAEECEEFKTVAEKLWPEEFEDEEDDNKVKPEELEIYYEAGCLVVGIRNAGWYLFRLTHPPGSYRVGCVVETRKDNDTGEYLVEKIHRR